MNITEKYDRKVCYYFDVSSPEMFLDICNAAFDLGLLNREFNHESTILKFKGVVGLVNGCLFDPLYGHVVDVAEHIKSHHFIFDGEIARQDSLKDEEIRNLHKHITQNYIEYERQKKLDRNRIRELVWKLSQYEQRGQEPKRERVFVFDEPAYPGTRMVTMTESEIRKSYFPMWSEKVRMKYGKDASHDFESCLEDWKVIHHAWEVIDY